METKLLAAEQSLEEEKQNLVQELKRVKTEAIHLMQVGLSQGEMCRNPHVTPHHKTEK